MPYIPGKLPQLNGDQGDALALAKYLEDELSAISSAQIDDILALELRPSYVAPLRPRTGMIVYADGTSWNPGAGEGAYVRLAAGTWAKLN